MRIQTLPYRPPKKRKINPFSLRRGTEFTYRGHLFGYAKDGKTLLVHNEQAKGRKWKPADVELLVKVLGGV